MSKSLQIEKPLVSVNWLYQHIDAANLVVLNATLPKVTSKSITEESIDFCIKNARFFDLKKEFSKQDAPFPNTMPSPDNFETKARKLGINMNSCIVVYDEYGIYSSARVWWLFKTMGYTNIAVLNGGFPEWNKKGYPTEKKQKRNYPIGDFTANYQSKMIISKQEVLKSLNTTSNQILDARSAGRFYATLPEPRAEVRSGHIPSSRSLPYSSLLNDFKLKTESELKEIFKKVNSESKELIFSCGSGITACVLALGATVSGYKKIAVYDGSWTEWGSVSDLPIEK